VCQRLILGKLKKRTRLPAISQVQKEIKTFTFFSPKGLFFILLNILQSTYRELIRIWAVRVRDPREREKNKLNE